MDTFYKDPDDVLDYSKDWSLWLLTDTIAASTWSVDDTGITVDSDAFTDTDATVVLSGGTLGNIYTATNHITTAAGYEKDSSIKVKIKSA